MKRALVIGSGAGGAAAAKELQGRFDVTVLEAGKQFKPLSLKLSTLETTKRTGLLFDEREIPLIFPPMKIRKTAEAMVLVNGVGLGGSTTLCTGNALRMDGDLKALGINLDDEFAEVYREIPISTAHRRRWRPTTERLFRICEQMGLDPQPTPKMGDYERCAGCGRCVLGCPRGVKWDSRRYLDVAVQNGARLITGCRAEAIEMRDGEALGVWARQGFTRQFHAADLIVVAAGGFETPRILENSGVHCESGLFVDPVLCVATRWADCRQCREMPMPFVVQRDGYMLSPYFDYLSFLFNPAWRYPAADTLALMIKLADASAGSVMGGRVEKTLTAADRQRLAEAEALCREILTQLGAAEGSAFLGTLNAGHPGGTLPLTTAEAQTLHHDRLPANLYVADATLLPRAMGNPPILTIVALAKRVARQCIENLG